MALKIIGAGLGRTGTLSLKFALTQLGFGPCYHMMDVFQDPKRIAQWNDIAAGQAPDWDAVFEGFASTVDWPACNNYKALMAQYPDAKVLLSVRPDAEKWFASTQATIFADDLAAGMPPFGPKIIADIVGPDRHDKAAVIAAYERHNAEVRAYAPKHKLLEFTPEMGWEPLCAWLGVPVPDTPYPQVNTTENFQAMVAARRSA